MQTIPCAPCCAEPLSVDVPGIEGPPGTSSNGSNAYTILTADNAVPALVGGTAVFQVANGLWAIAGQMIVVAGPSTYRVTSAGLTSITAVWQQAVGDVAGGTAILSGAGVSPSGVTSMTNLSVTAAGTAYSLTATAAKVDFGTTDPSLTISAAGTYLLIAQFRLDYNGATFAAARNVVMKLRRTNNTAADVAVSILDTQVVTTLSLPFEQRQIPMVIYTTANTNDVIEMWGNVGVVPTAGSLDVTAASIVALKIV